MKPTLTILSSLIIAVAGVSCTTGTSRQMLSPVDAELDVAPSASRAYTLDSSNFASFANRPLVLVGFYERGNGLSMQMEPTLDRLAQTFQGAVPVGKMSTAGSTGIRIYRYGNIVQSLPGVIDAEVIVTEVNRFL